MAQSTDAAARKGDEDNIREKHFILFGTSLLQLVLQLLPTHFKSNNKPKGH